MGSHPGGIRSGWDQDSQQGSVFFCFVFRTFPENYSSTAWRTRLLFHSMLYAVFLSTLFHVVASGSIRLPFNFHNFHLNPKVEYGSKQKLLRTRMGVSLKVEVIRMSWKLVEWKSNRS